MGGKELFDRLPYPFPNVHVQTQQDLHPQITGQNDGSQLPHYIMLNNKERVPVVHIAPLLTREQDVEREGQPWSLFHVSIARARLPYVIPLLMRHFLDKLRWIVAAGLSFVPYDT